MSKGNKGRTKGGKVVFSNSFPFAPVQKDFQLPSIASVGFEPPAGGPPPQVLGNPVDSPRTCRTQKKVIKANPQVSPASPERSPEVSQRSSPQSLGYDSNQSTPYSSSQSTPFGSNHSSPRGSNRSTPYGSNRSTPRRLLPIPKTQFTPLLAEDPGYDDGLGQGDWSTDTVADDRKKQNEKKPKRKNPTYVTPRRTPLNLRGLPKSPKASKSDDCFVKKQVVPQISPFERLLAGNLDDLPPQRSSVVRVFLSSTFSDFKVERNALVKHAYPELKQFCADLRLDFQVVDLRWGISEEATNDHNVAKLCLLEVEQCQRLSRGTNFVALLGDRYGFRPIPPEIKASEFELLREIADDLKLEGRVTMDTWYRRDDNAEPPVYILQPIDSRLCHFTDTNPDNAEAKQADSRKWNTISGYLATILRQCATEAVKRNKMKAEQEHVYYSSVTEHEVTKGILTAPDRNTTCLAFIRHLSGLEADIHNPETDIKRYVDLTKDAAGSTVIDTEVQELRTRVHKKTIPDKLQKSNIREFTVPWKPKGVNPEEHSSHEDYVRKLCEGFCHGLKREVQSFWEKEKKEIMNECTVANILHNPSPAPKQPRNGEVKVKVKGQGAAMFGFGDDPRLAADLLKGQIAVQQMIHGIEAAAQDTADKDVIDQSRIALHSEVLHHMYLCLDKCRVFCGRQRELAKVEQNLKHTHLRQPLFVHASSGAGKTAFSAMLAKKARTWLGKKAVIILRFLGTSPHSSVLRTLLISVCEQICAAYKILPDKRKLQKKSKVIKYLQELLLHVSIMFGSLRPLVIILDSLDQLSPLGGAHELSWLPLDIPSGVHLIVSVKPEAGGLLSQARLVLKDKTSCFMELSEMTENIILEYIGAYSTAQGRNFTDAQCEYLSEHLSKYPQPLLMKISLDEACRWRSYTDIDTVKLPENVKQAISMLFDRYEKKFGQTFMGSALGYITASKGGIGHIELEDALSCSDDVLSDVYKYHNPPVDGIIRIPPLLWVRAKYDLRDYIVERIAQGKATLFWYHYQFYDVARERYLTEQTTRQLHATLAEIYGAEQPIKRTITLQQRKLTITDADRQVALQPLTAINTRKLVTLPYHLLHAGDSLHLRDLCWCNLHFLSCYSEGFSFYELLASLSDALSERTDMQVQLVYDCLRFSATILTTDIESLPVQILGSLLKYGVTHPSIQTLCTQCVHDIMQRSKMCLLPTLGSIPLMSKTLKWYNNGPSLITTTSKDKSHMVLLHSGQRRSLYQVINSDTLELGGFLQSPSLHDGDVAIHSVLSANCQKVFLLYSEHVQIYNTQSGQRLGRFSVLSKPGGNLNHQMTLSPDDQYLVLGGTDRLAMYELVSQQGGLDYKPRAAMNLTGALATTNLIFSHDVNRIISTHTLKGKKSTFGAVILWNFWEKQLKMRVGLPSEVVPQFLYRLQPLAHHDLVICGCDDGYIAIVDMDLGKIIVEVNNPLALPGPQSVLLTSFDPTSSLLLTGVKGQRSVQVWNMDILEAQQVTTLTLEDSLTALSLTGGGKTIVLGVSTGNISFYAANENSSPVRSIKAHDDAVTGIICEHLDQVFTVSADNSLKQWDMEVVEDIDSPSTTLDQEATTKDSIKAQCLEDEVLICSCVTVDGQTIITGRAYSSKKQTVITGSTAGVKIWKRDQMTYIYQRTLRYGSTTQLRLGPGDTQLIALTNQKPALLDWEDSGQEVDVMNADKAQDVIDLFVKGQTVVMLSGVDDKACILVLDLGTKDIQEKCSVRGLSPTGCTIDGLLHNGKFVVLRKAITVTTKVPVAYHMMSVDMATGHVITCSYDDPNSSTTAQSVFSCCRYDDNTMYLGCNGDVFSWQPQDKCCQVIQPENKSWLKHFLCVYGVHGDMNTETMHKTPVTMVTTSVTKQLVVTGGDDGSLVLWKEDVKSGKGAIFKGHSGTITSGVLTKEANYLVTGSRDRTIQLWNLTTRLRLCTVHIHMSVDHVAFSQNESMILAQASDTDKAKIFAFDVVGQNAKSTFFVTQ